MCPVRPFGWPEVEHARAVVFSPCFVHVSSAGSTHGDREAPDLALLSPPQRRRADQQADNSRLALPITCKLPATQVPAHLSRGPAYRPSLLYYASHLFLSLHCFDVAASGETQWGGQVGDHVAVANLLRDCCCALPRLLSLTDATPPPPPAHDACSFLSPPVVRSMTALSSPLSACAPGPSRSPGSCDSPRWASPQHGCQCHDRAACWRPVGAVYPASCTQRCSHRVCSTAAGAGGPVSHAHSPLLKWGC